MIVTSAAKCFIKEKEISPEAMPLLDDEGEWKMWDQMGDPVLHIELRKWADFLVIAPLSANTLAKMAQVFHPEGYAGLATAMGFHVPIFCCNETKPLLHRYFTKVHIQSLYFCLFSFCMCKYDIFLLNFKEQLLYSCDRDRTSGIEATDTTEQFL